MIRKEDPMKRKQMKVICFLLVSQNLLYFEFLAWANTDFNFLSFPDQLSFSKYKMSLFIYK